MTCASLRQPDRAVPAQDPRRRGRHRQPGHRDGHHPVPARPHRSGRARRRRGGRRLRRPDGPGPLGRRAPLARRGALGRGRRQGPGRAHPADPVDRLGRGRARDHGADGAPGGRAADGDAQPDRASCPPPSSRSGPAGASTSRPGAPHGTGPATWTRWSPSGRPRHGRTASSSRSPRRSSMEAGLEPGHLLRQLDASSSASCSSAAGWRAARSARRRAPSAAWPRSPRRRPGASPATSRRTSRSKPSSVGDLLRVRPGDRVPVDGVIVHGASAIDEALLTGEPIPAAKGPGDEVIGATRQHHRHVRHARDARRTRHRAGPDRRPRPARPGLEGADRSGWPTASPRSSCRPCSWSRWARSSCGWRSGRSRG